MTLTSTPSVYILLATYNGEKYLSAQIESLILQTFVNWQLIIRDDGSTDKTNEIIDYYCQTHTNIKRIVDEKGVSGSASKNFSLLMEAALSADKVDYYFFCDQDDIWNSEKLEIFVKRLTTLENDYGQSTPLLVHCDLAVVSANMQLISPSFLNFQNISHCEHLPVRHLVSQNFVTGCACAFNRRLLELSTPISEYALVHDWWLALVASVSGKIVFIDNVLVQYRQHENNEIGAIGYRKQINPFGFDFYRRLFASRKALKKCILQCNAVKDSLLYKNKEADYFDQSFNILISFSTIRKQRRLKRLITLFRLKLFKRKLLQNILFTLLIMTL